MAGGTTVCVGIAKEDGSLEVANLGDSGFVQLRLNTIHNYSQDQMLMIGIPYQLTIIPQKMKNAYIHNFPKDASVTKHSLQHGDVLVFATDGVWDNLSKEDVLQIVNKLMVGKKAWEPTQQGIRVGERITMSTTPQAENQSISSLQSSLATDIASEAKATSANKKVDDICVVVAIVIEEGK
jgi:protein phosphatase PTC7